MSNSHVKRPNYQMTRDPIQPFGQWVIGSCGHLTTELDIGHWTSQHWNVQGSYRPPPLVRLSPIGRDAVYATMLIMSSAVSFATTGFIRSVHSPLRALTCMS